MARRLMTTAAAKASIATHENKPARPIWTKLPYIQSSIARLVAATKIQSTASVPWILANTQINHADAASMGKAKACLKRCIHGPGLGSRDKSPGQAASNK